MQCVFIDKNGKTPPPPPRNNDNSTRAASKKHRVYVLRDFLHDNFQSILSGNNNNLATILDVAGGRGDLSFILSNVDGINSIIADPRIPNHRRLVKSINFLIKHPEEVTLRAVEGLPTSQPLAKLLPRLLENQGITWDETNSILLNNGSSGEGDCNDIWVDFDSPKYVRIHIDNTLVENIRNVLSATDECERDKIWDTYWREEKQRIDSNNVYYGGTLPKTNTHVLTDDNRIIDSKEALEVFQSLDLILGFHPDQATEACIDLALLLGLPFAVVPCCVFPSEFPERKLLDGERVRTYNELVNYLCKKHDNIRMTELPFIETDTAKNTVLYMLKEDFES